jgi:fused signal recognition particle receptor
VQRLVGIFSGKKELDPELVAQIEEVLLTGDVGVSTTEKLIAALKERLDKKDLGNEALVWQTLREVTREVIDVPAAPFGAKRGDGPLVILVVGVNGVGKTTTIGKLAARYKEQGKKVYLAAGDTFRAAAVAQLEAWGKRVGVHTIKGKDLTKPSAVVYDAVQQGAKDGVDVVIADTAGRLHTKTPLMDELRKLGDAANKALAGAPHEILLVLDATTGQNAVVQVNEFKSALAVSGIVLTKLDGTAKGGVILSVCEEHKIPVRFVGVGEKVDDLREFDAEEFSEALFSAAGEGGEGAEGAA